MRFWPSGFSALAPDRNMRRKSRACLFVSGASRMRSWMRSNSSVANTYRQRSWPRVTTTPAPRSSRNFAGRMTRPLSSSFGLCVPSNIAGSPPFVRPPEVCRHFTPLSSTSPPPRVDFLLGPSPRAQKNTDPEVGVVVRPVSAGGSAALLATIPSVVHAVHEGGCGLARGSGSGRAALERAAHRGDGEDDPAEHQNEADHTDNDEGNGDAGDEA